MSVAIQNFLDCSVLTLGVDPRNFGTQWHAEIAYFWRGGVNPATWQLIGELCTFTKRLTTGEICTKFLVELLHVPQQHSAMSIFWWWIAQSDLDDFLVIERFSFQIPRPFFGQHMSKVASLLFLMSNFGNGRAQILSTEKMSFHLGEPNCDHSFLRKTMVCWASARKSKKKPKF